MKKKILFIPILLLTFFRILFSDTVIPPGDVLGTWEITGSPYLIEGEISIPNGETLLIDPGVLVEFQGHYKFNVQGRLLAIGTEQDSIYFTINDTTGFSNYSIPDGGWHGIRFDNTPTTNDSSKIIYCKLEYGKALGSNPDYLGGAIYCCALYSGFSKIQIINSKITNNYAGCGGGIALKFSSVILRNSYISHNISGYCGGGIYCKNSYLNSGSDIVSNQISHNFATQEGGGIYGIRLKVSNSLIYFNIAEYGGGIYSEGNSNIINCTLSENIAQLKGGALFCTDSEMSEVQNCILWNNNAFEEGDQIALLAYWYAIPWNFVYVPANIDLRYNNIEEGYDGISLFFEGSTPQFPITYNILYYYNLDSDPLFINPENGNFRFFSDSPCINTGTPDTTGLNLPEYDLDGNPRIYDGRIDMGCYEWQGTEADNFKFQISNFKLGNYPNPFNPSGAGRSPTTTIYFSTTQHMENTEIVIYNIKGQKIKTLAVTLSGVEGSVIWNGTDENNHPVSSGIYFYQLKINEKCKAVKKCLLLK